MNLKLKKRWRSLDRILETVKYALNDHFLFVSMLLFDFLFLLFIGLIMVLTKNMFTITQPFALYMLLAYYLLIIIAYSFFKFIILRLIRKMVNKDRFSFRGLVGFFSLNFIVLNALLVIFLAFSAAAYSVVAEEYQAYIVRAIFLAVVVMAYPLVNLAHSFFMQHLSVKESIIKGLRMFRKASMHMHIYAFSILAAAAYLLVYASIAWVLKSLFFGDAVLEYNNTYITIFFVISLLAFYVILAFNRIYFYLAAEEGA